MLDFVFATLRRTTLTEVLRLMNVLGFRLSSFAIALAVASFVGSAQAVDIPTIEDFNVDVANWADSSGLALLTHVAGGGPDGSGYASTQYAFNSGGGAGGTSAVLIRGQDEFNSSGNAFVGDWVADKITKLTVDVRHNAPLPLNYFGRFSAPGNFPGATAVQFVPVLPNVWTTLTFDLSPTNPQFVTFEGSSFGGVFSNIGHVQLGVSIPAALANDSTGYVFDLDNVVATPEPTALCLAAFALGAAVLPRRRSC
jgi:hypothetical protein